MSARSLRHIGILLLVTSVAAGNAMARSHHAVTRAPHAAVAPGGVLLSPGDTWREVANAPASPLLGPTPSSGVMGGTFPGLERPGHGSASGDSAVQTGKLEGSPPLGPQGPTGGLLPSAQPGWRPSGR